MRTLILDTETTGLVNHKSPDHTIQPHPVQLACILVQENKIMSMVSVIVNPSVPIHEGASKVHGLTTEVVEHVGISVKAATGLFLNFLNKADRIVAHNIDFDIIVTEAMIYRSLADYDLDNYRRMPRVCTMHSTSAVCRLPGKFGKYKWPKLSEAYSTLVDPTGFEGAHDAMTDVIACWKVLKALEERGLPLLRGTR
jgi:DNA polymerase III subunit epsilon